MREKAREKGRKTQTAELEARNREREKQIRERNVKIGSRCSEREVKAGTGNQRQRGKCVLRQGAPRGGPSKRL